MSVLRFLDLLSFVSLHYWLLLLADDLRRVNLINLVEVLSGKSVGKYRKFSQVSSGTATTKDRQLRMHFQHNIDKALKFLVNEEELKLVNVGAKDIVDQNESITLGLVWKLILRYHISQGATDKSAKKDLVAWIRSRIGPDTKYGLDIKNLTTDFQDGKALLALCDACSPGSMTGERNEGVVYLTLNQTGTPISTLWSVPVVA